MNKENLMNCLKLKMTQRQIAASMKVSQTTVKYWIKKFQLSSGRKIKNGPNCNQCGNNNKINFYRRGRNFSSYCKRCTNVRAIERFRQYKKQAVDYKGGQCQKCGYNKCMGSLGFHHVDPNSKSINFKSMKQWNFERYKSELDKCILLCNNCHGEIHYLS